MEVSPHRIQPILAVGLDIYIPMIIEIELASDEGKTPLLVPLFPPHKAVSGFFISRSLIFICLW